MAWQVTVETTTTSGAPQIEHASGEDLDQVINVALGWVPPELQDAVRADLSKPRPWWDGGPFANVQSPTDPALFVTVTVRKVDQ